MRPSPTPRNCLLAGEWAISAPAAVLGRGSHLSGSLSGVGPRSPVTRRRLGSPLHYQQADRAASQSPLLATVSRGYRPRRADRRGITEPFAVPIFTGMHGLISEASIYVRQNQPGASCAAPAAAVLSPRCPWAVVWVLCTSNRIRVFLLQPQQACGSPQYSVWRVPRAGAAVRGSRAVQKFRPRG